MDNLDSTSFYLLKYRYNGRYDGHEIGVRVNERNDEQEL